MLCVNTHYINRHLAMLDRQDAEAERISARVAELTAKGAEYYPFSRENIMEALGGLNENQELILQHSLENDFNEIGLMIGNWIEGYWILQAEKKAVREFKGR